MPPTIPCACCKGSGRLALSGVYLTTWEALRQIAPLSITPTDLGRRLGVTETAMANRLAYLSRQGLATVERDGRRKLYKVVT